jgi:hypothetical protein
MSEIDSWWLKTDRAKKHLEEIESYARSYAKRGPYEIVGPGQPKKQRGVWIYRLHITEQPDPMLAVIAGEFLYDLRSALDHIAVALVPRRRRRWASFPVVNKDIWEKDAAGNYVIANDKARSSFDRAIQGAPTEAVAIIKQLQPYHVRGADEVSFVGFLSSLQNADKHRNLISLAPGIETTDVLILSPYGISSLPSPDFHEDGAVIATLEPKPGWREAEVHVEVRGTVSIAIKVAGAQGYAGIDHLRALLGFVRTEVLSTLTLFVPRS